MDFNKSLLKEAKSLKNTSLSIIGRSVMGKELFLIRKGEGKRRIFISAAHHANEWITALVLMKFLKDSESLTEFSKLLLHNELFVLPLANPDGAALVRGELNKGDFFENAKRIAEEFPEIPFPQGWKANISGYDLNLAYPAGFEKAKKIKGEKGFNKPAPRDYPGKTPVSQPESLAVYKLVYENDFDMLLTFHTQGRVIYHKYGKENPKGSVALAEKMSNASGYKFEKTPWESSNAGLKDWFIKRYNRPGYTIEAGQGESPLPLSDFENIYKECYEILKTAIEWL